MSVSQGQPTLSGKRPPNDSGGQGPPYDGPVPNREAYERAILGRLDRAWLSRPPVRIALFILLIVVLVIPSVQFSTRILEIDHAPHREGGVRYRTALGRWLPTIEMMGDPEPDDPYGEGHWLPLTPFILMCLRPLSYLGVLGAGLAWSVLKLAGIGLSMWLLIRSLRCGPGSADAKRPEPGLPPHDRRADVGLPLPVGVILITAAFALRPVIGDIQHGNINLFVLVWLALAWACYLQRQDVLCGLLIALAVATKVTPGLALVYFAYKREWRVCLAAGVGLILAFGIMPSLWIGVRENLALHESWFTMLIHPFVVDGYAVITGENQSLYGVVLRLSELTGLVPISHAPLADMLDAGMDNIARPTGIAAVILRPMVSLSVVGLLVYACRTPTGNRRDLRLFLEFGMVLLAMLLLSERTWKHHATFLAIPYLAIWYAVACLHWPKGIGNVLVVALGVQFVLLAGTTKGIWGSDLGNDLLFYGVFCWGLVLCFIQSAYLIRKLTPRSRSDGGKLPAAGVSAAGVSAAGASSSR